MHLHSFACQAFSLTTIVPLFTDNVSVITFCGHMYFSSFRTRLALDDRILTTCSPLYPTSSQPNLLEKWKYIVGICGDHGVQLQSPQLPLRSQFRAVPLLIPGHPIALSLSPSSHPCPRNLPVREVAAINNYFAFADDFRLRRRQCGPRACPRPRQPRVHPRHRRACPQHPLPRLQASSFNTTGGFRHSCTHL